MTVPADRTINNTQDTSRRYPTTALAERVLLATEGTVRERLAGGAIAASVLLAQPISPNTPVHILAFVTATGAAAAKALLDLTTDYTVVEQNAGGVGELVMVTNQSANTLVIDYSPDQAEGTIGGQSSATA